MKQEVPIIGSVLRTQLDKIAEEVQSAFLNVLKKLNAPTEQNCATVEEEVLNIPLPVS